MTTTAAFLAVLTGLLTGAGLIVAIGPQNVYLLRQGVRRQHVVTVIAICAVSDIVLITAGVAGLGPLIHAHPSVVGIAKIAGGIYVCALGIAAARRVRRAGRISAEELSSPGSVAVGRWAAVGTALALTWLNPHVYLDTVLTLGAIANSHGHEGKWLFAVGAWLASIVWFTGIGWGATKLAPLFARQRAWQILDSIVAVIMLIVGVTLLASV